MNFENIVRYLKIKTARIIKNLNLFKSNGRISGKLCEFTLKVKKHVEFPGLHN